MTLDLTLLAAVAVMALLGAISGASRQLGTALAIPFAFALSAPAATLLTPVLSRTFRWSSHVTSAASMVIIFLVSFVLLRAVLSFVFSRIFSLGDIKDRTLDRLVGALLGAVKIALPAWIILSTFEFARVHLEANTKRFDLGASDSVILTFCRDFNAISLVFGETAPVKRISSTPAGSTRSK